MTLSDIYRNKVELANQSRFAADIEQNYEEKLQRRENTLHLQGDANAIAHCIAMWGDLEVERLDCAALWAETKKISWQYHNPWHRGLTIVCQEYNSSKLDVPFLE
jgi:hypothetical protein